MVKSSFIHDEYGRNSEAKEDEDKRFQEKS